MEYHKHSSLKKLVVLLMFYMVASFSNRKHILYKSSIINKIQSSLSKKAIENGHRKRKSYKTYTRILYKIKQKCSTLQHSPVLRIIMIYNFFYLIIEIIFI